MNKVIRDGKVAVLYSEGYGAGWITWNSNHSAILYDPTVVAWVESGKPEDDEFRLGLENKYPGIYLGGLRNLETRWVPQGKRFRVEEYDGYERVVIEGEVTDFEYTA